jgi:predicted KAP-like P-loop ATPase
MEDYRYCRSYEEKIESFVINIFRKLAMPLILTRIEYKEFFKRLPVIPDAPVGSDADLFKFDRYVGPLISILTDPEQKTPFTIGIFGPWGSGKSSVLNILNEKLATDQYKNQFVRVEFNPWLYRTEGNMLIPLLNSLRDALEEDPQNRFFESVKKLGEILFRLGADVLLKSLTADQVSLEKLEKLEKVYVEERGKTDSIVRRLRKLLVAELAAVNKSGAKVVVFIDDLDRCEPADIINVLEAVKLFLDLEHVFVIFALDREVVTRGIQIRYKDFKFEDDRAAAIGSEYIEKMIQLPIELFPLDQEQISGFLEGLCPKDANAKLQGAIKLLRTMASPNPRRIKRLLNSFAVVRSLVDQEKLEELDAGILLRLVVLQVQYPELYIAIARKPELLVALEESYQGKRNADKDTDFGSYDDATAVQQFCKKNYRPSSLMSGIFATSEFEKVKDSLQGYLTMLGDRNAKG